MKYLFIEPYIYIAQKDKKCLFYDTLSYSHLFINNTRVAKIINQLIEDSNSQYYVAISDKELDTSKSILNFISKIKKLYIGDIYEFDNNELPVAFAPVPNFYPKKQKLDNDDFKFNIPHLKLINEVRIYLNSECEHNCQICDWAYQQIGCCNKKISLKEIKIEQLENIAKQLEFSGVKKIIFSGGNILKFQYLKDIMRIFSKFSHILEFEINFKNISDRYDLLNQFSNSSVSIIISDIENVFQKLKYFSPINNSNRPKIEFRYLISSRQELKILSYMKDTFKGAIKPIFTRNNIDFFEEMVYLSSKDIINNKLSLRDIHIKQFLNTNYFGDLVINSNNDFFDITHENILGNIDSSSLAKIVSNALNISWTKVRNEQPCCDCIYQWLCPSPSNYELAIRKPNLCHVK